MLFRSTLSSEIDTKNSREILQANRALMEKMAKRLNDIYFMESQILEYDVSIPLATFEVNTTEEE